MRYVWADIFFVVNFLFDFSLLYLAGRLARTPVVGRRLAWAAAAGSGFAVAALFPGLGRLMTPPAEIIASALMVALAYPDACRTPRSYLRTLGFFYLASFAVGGAALGWNYLMTGKGGLGPGPGGGALGPAAVLPAALFGGVLLHWAFVTGREHRRLAALCIPCRVEVEGAAAEFHGLVDTGNRLRDPLSDAPVVIVEYPAVKGLLPPGLRYVWRGPVEPGESGPVGQAAPDTAAGGAEPEDGEEPDLGRLAEVLGGTSWLARVRLVPFSSLGRANGLLVGFRPDAVTVVRGGRPVRRTDVVVCLSPRPLSAEGGYRALLPPEILDGRTAA